MTVRVDTAGPGDADAVMALLLLADPSEGSVGAALRKGTLHVARDTDDRVVGAAVVVPVDARVVELTQLAVAPERQRAGHGATIVRALVDAYRARGYARMRVGTANSSLGNLAFYQKLGFRLQDLRHGFFDAYPEPIVEHGIRARDLVVMERAL